jgi:hypothetical protein
MAAMASNANSVLPLVLAWNFIDRVLLSARRSSPNPLKFVGGGIDMRGK